MLTRRERMKTLSELKQSQSGRVKEIGASESTKRRMMDIGITKDAVVEVKGFAPMGDPMLISARGVLLAIRKSDARSIFVEDLPS